MRIHGQKLKDLWLPVAFAIVWALFTVYLRSATP